MEYKILMVEKKRDCPTHNMPAIIYCVPCQQAICAGCVTDHSAKSHQLMHQSDYAKNVLKAQVAELLTALTAEEAKCPVPDKKEIAASSAELEQFISRVSKALDKVKTYASELKAWSENPSALNPQKAIEMRLRRMIEEIDKVGKATPIERIQDLEAAYKELAEAKASQSLRSALSQGALVESVKALELQLRGLEAATELACQHIPQYSFLAYTLISSKFVAENHYPSHPFLWELSNGALTTRKRDNPYIITICSVDTPITTGTYRIVYRIDNYIQGDSDDSADSMGIGPKSTFSLCAFHESRQYGLLNNRIVANGAYTPVSYHFKAEDTITIVYSSSDHTLTCSVNGSKIGDCIKGIPEETYYTGVAFKNVGTTVTLVSFTKT